MKFLKTMIIAFLLIPITLVSQNIVDSLITVLEKDKPEREERLELLLDICDVRGL